MQSTLTLAPNIWISNHGEMQVEEGVEWEHQLIAVGSPRSGSVACTCCSFVIWTCICEIVKLYLEDQDDDENNEEEANDEDGGGQKFGVSEVYELFWFVIQSRNYLLTK